MFSKALRRGIAIALSMTALAGCSLRLGEEPVSQAPLELSGQTACLKGTSKVLVDYFNGRASEDRIASLFDCSSRSLKLFSQWTRGKKAGVYTAGELRNFLERYFLNKGGEIKVRLTPEMMAELMELKRVLLGGSGETLTEEELVQAQEFIQILKNQLIRLRPFLPLKVERYVEGDEQHINAAIMTLESVGREISAVIRRTGFDYKFTHLARLVEELEKAADPDDAASIRRVREHLGAFQHGKSALTGRDSSRIGSDEWELLLNSTTKWYGMFLRFSYIRARYPSMVRFEGREKTVQIAKEILEMLGESVFRHHPHFISFDSLDALVDSLTPDLLSWNGKAIAPEHAKKIVKVVIRRALGGAKLGSDGRQADGVTQEVVENALVLLQTWSEGQRYLDLLFERLSEQNGFPEYQLAKFPRSVLLAEGLEDVFKLQGAEMTPTARRAADRIRSIIGQYQPIFTGESLEISVQSFGSDPEFSYYGLTHLNWMNLLGRMLIDGYGETPEDLNEGLRYAAVEQFYQDLREVGIDLGLFDPKNTKVAYKRFSESDILLFSSNGDRRMNEREATEVLAYMISAKAVAKRAHKQIADVCNRKAHEENREVPTDLFGVELVDAECYRERFFGNIESVWKTLPGLARYYASLSVDQQHAFAKNLEDAARGFSNQPFSSPDSETMMGLAQYVETVFARYDRDRSGVLRDAEAFEGSDPAFPVFKRALVLASCNVGKTLTRDWELQKLFSYLLAKGRTPSAAEFIGWIVGDIFTDAKADRGRIVEILAELARSGRASGGGGKAECEVLADR